LSQLIFLPSMLLGGLMLPYGVLPRAAQIIAQLLPSTHAMNAFKGLAMGQTADFWPWGSVLILLAGGVTAFGLAFYLFRWDSQHTTRRLPTAVALLAVLPYAVGIVAFL
jgi:ABC-2 type transport system permease protein